MARVLKNVNMDAVVGISWHGLDCVFDDWLYIPHINPGRDRLPPNIKTRLASLSPGEQIEQFYRPGELVSGWRPERRLQLRTDPIQPADHTASSITARVGRYYPPGYFSQIAGIQPLKDHPCRVIDVTDDHKILDCNHPLSRHSIRLMIQIEAVRPVSDDGNHGHGRDIAAMLCDQGPGMQDRLPQQETDFFSDQPFDRRDQGDDAEYFREPSLEPFWDRRALAEVTAQYNRLIPSRAHILDLMAGAHSPLEESALDMASVCCAGLNAEELAHNPLCHQRQVLNVNTIRTLPYADEQFDAVMIHAAIEYATRPFVLFGEISRVLKPRGRIIISFSNRSLPQKVIRLWRDADEFERPAIILSYLRSTRTFANFHGYSKRGLSAAAEDQRAGYLHSDPVYLVWADKVC